MVWQAAALPFGRTQVQLGTVQNNLRFPGQYFDAETGLLPPIAAPAGP